MTTVAPTPPASPVSATPPAYSPADSPPAFLLVEQPNTRYAGPILGRVLIGRRAANHIVIPIPGVAQIHAWIIQSADGHTLWDSGSLVGTLVNDRRVQSRHELQTGDVIRIGPVAIQYLTDPAAVAGAEPLDLADRPVATRRPEEGQYIDCACGAPLWVPRDLAGEMGQCRYCNQTVSVQTKQPFAPPAPPAPHAPHARATPPAYPPADSPRPLPPRATPPAYSPADSPHLPSPAPKTLCGICQSAIAPDEPDHACPACGTPFHADCWTENRGCSSYGCAQVNILDPTPQSPPLGGGESELPAPPTDHDAPPLPWEFLILAGAVVGSIAGVWTFGIPPLAAAIAAIIGLRKRPHHRAVLYIALPFAAIGCAAGIAISYFWWFAGRHHR